MIIKSYLTYRNSETIIIVFNLFKNEVRNLIPLRGEHVATSSNQ